MPKPIFPWMGNKEKLIPYIRQMIPPGIKQFAEVFGGSGALILSLTPQKKRLDIYNDLNDDLFNVFCCIKEKPIALAKELQFLPIHGRTPFAFYRSIVAHEPEFYKHIETEKKLLLDRTSFTEEQAETLLRILEGRAHLFDVQRAAAFLMVMHGSFSGTGSSVGIKTVDVDSIVSRLPEVSRRLQSIVLENQSALNLIPKRDRIDGLIYADPPYVDAEKCYDVSFPYKNHLILHDRLRKCVGYTILSYNDCLPVREWYQDDFFIFSLKRENPLSQTGGATYGELIITNYDPRPLMDSQIALFDPTPETKWELVLLNTPNHILKTL